MSPRKAVDSPRQMQRIRPRGPFRLRSTKDIAAVAAAVDTPWSTGQVEGQINRLKTIKRQMYGRAGFELLRARVLPYSPAAFIGPAP